MLFLPPAPDSLTEVQSFHYLNTMLQRNLLYTGVTRGKQLVVLLGQKKAVAIAVRNVSGRRRWSKLASGCVPVHPFRGRPAWRAEPWW